MRADELVTVGQVSESLGIQLAKLSKAIEKRALPVEPIRVGRVRCFRVGDIPAIREALVRGSYLRPSTPVIPLEEVLGIEAATAS